MAGKAIVISGTPGVGKTAVALKLAEVLGAKYLNLSDFVLSNELYMEYDSNTNSFIIDEQRLRNTLNELISKSDGYVVIDSHYGEVVSDELIYKLLVLRLDPRMLYKRLVDKGWIGRKLLDNLEAELVGVCTFNALAEHDKSKVCEVDVTGKDLNDVIAEVLGIINGEVICETKVDWLKDGDVVEDVVGIISSSN